MIKYLIWTIGVLLSGISGYALAETFGWWGLIPSLPVAIWIAGGNAIFGYFLEEK